MGWATADYLRCELIERALRNALEHRRPSGPLLHHSDRGVQYACDDYRELLRGHGLEVSMGRKGDCWHNAAMEGFFGALKREPVHQETYAKREEARGAQFEPIEVFSDRQRPYSALNWPAPVQYEESRKLPRISAY